jgi:hypothetical protein
MSAILRTFTGSHRLGRATLLDLVASGTPAAICWRGLNGSVPVAANTLPAVLIQIGGCRRPVRIARWVLLPFARARVERLLGRGGASATAVYAIAPDCEAPMWVYRVGSPAATYAHTHLMPRGAGGRLLRGAVRWWTGCDPAVAGLLIVGVTDASRDSTPRT